MSGFLLKVKDVFEQITSLCIVLDEGKKSIGNRKKKSEWKLLSYQKDVNAV